MSSLDDLRRRINELDRQILELVGKRQETSREVARAKRATGQATRDYNREREVLLAAREAGRQYGVSPAARREHPAAADPLFANYPGAGQRRGAGRGQRPHRAGDRRRRQDGALVRRVHGVAGVCRRDRGSGRRAAGIRPPGRLARIAVEPGLHRDRHAARGHRQDPAGAGDAPPQGRDLRRRFAQVTAARRVSTRSSRTVAA